MANIGNYDKPYISAINYLDDRDIFPDVANVNNDDRWLRFMAMTGRRNMTKMAVYHSFYADSVYNLIDTTGSVVTNSGTSQVTVTSLTSAYAGLAVVSDLIKFPDGKVGRVQTVSTTSIANDTLVIKSVDGSNLTLVAGNVLSDFSNAQEEASQSPTSQRWGNTSITNQIQVFSKSCEITDIQNMSYVTVKFNGDPHMTPQKIINTLQRHQGDVALALWMGQPSTTLFSDASPALTGAQGNGVQTTRGLESYIDAYGVNGSIITPGQITIADLQDITDRLTAAKAPMEFDLVGGNSPVTTMSIMLKNLGSAGAQSVRILDEGGTFNFDATKFTFGQYTFFLQAFPILSNPDTTNYAASGGVKLEIARSLFGLPRGNCPVVGGNGLNGASAGSMPYWQYRYMQQPAATGGTRLVSDNGEITEINTGGLAPTPTDSDLVWRTRFTSNVGLQLMAPQKFLKWVVN